MAKPLVTTLLIVNGLYVMAGSVDPSSGGGVAAPVGSVYLYSAGSTWVKVGAGDPDWVDFRALATDTTIGLVPATGGGTANYLRANGVGPPSWQPIIPTTPGFYGTGIDGDITFPVGTTSLARVMFYRRVTIPAGAIVEMNGYIIFASDFLDAQPGSIIRRNGTNAVLSVAGTTPPGGYLGTGANGSNGATGSAGSTTNLTAQPFPLPLTGPTSGLGGRGGGNGVAGTATGTIAQQSSTFGGLWSMPYISQLTYAGAGNNAPGGGGGTGGNGSGSVVLGLGGGGGGGAGTFTLVARLLNLEGTVQAIGGNGANAQGANGGGGGGGGGGKIIEVYSERTGASVPSVAGGLGGAGTGTFLNGADGSTGYYTQIQA